MVTSDSLSVYDDVLGSTPVGKLLLRATVDGILRCAASDSDFLQLHDR